AVVSGRLQLLLMRSQDVAVRKPLETAQRAVGDAAEVVRRVLGFSAAQPVAETTRVDLNEIAADVIELTRPRWQDAAQLHNAMVDIRFEPGEDVVVAGEPAPLREVLMNLVLNALDAMPGGGALTLRTWVQDGWVYCTLGEDGHRVLTAGGGREALTVLDGGERVDVVITGLGMPGMTGWELARALRTRQPDLPVGLISGWTSSADFSAEEASHVAFVIAKPYTLGALRTALAPFRPRR